MNQDIQGGAAGWPTDAHVIAALHACGIDTRPSRYGFNAMQIDGTSVLGLRQVFQKLVAQQSEAAPTIEVVYGGKDASGPFTRVIPAKHVERGAFGTWAAFIDSPCEQPETAQAPTADRESDSEHRSKWNTKQWYQHVGAWETPEGFISFGSVMAVRAMLIQFGRAHASPAAHPANTGDLSKYLRQRALAEGRNIPGRAPDHVLVHTDLLHLAANELDRLTIPSPVGGSADLTEAQADHIARSYFSDEYDQQKVKNAIHDAFKTAIASRPAALAAPTQAALDVLAERRRQIEVEGWTPEYDDKYSNCELARAAATYALCSHIEQLKLCGDQVWPWHADWWKRGSYRRDLEKAGALIIAEIERVDRAAAPAAPEGQGLQKGSAT